MNKIITKAKKIFKSQKAKNIARTTLLSLAMFCFLNVSAYASIQSTTLFTGSKKLFQDALTALLVIIPLAAAVVGTYFAIRMGFADEQDKKTWANRLKILGVGFILSLTITGLLTVLASYFQ